jgi:arylsulfatase A-like enzyme
MTSSRRTLRRAAPWFLLLLASALVVAVIWWPTRHRIPDRIILIVVDTLRRDYLSCYGSTTRTPQIDAMAARGRVFTNALSSYHATTMSMAALFTGHAPSISSGDPDRSLPVTSATWCGLSRFASRDSKDRCVPQAVPTLAEQLGSVGYWTVGVVSNSLLFRPYGYDRGFREWFQVGRPWREPSDAAAVNQAVNDWLKGRPSDRFFLYVHYMDVHDRMPKGSLFDPELVDAETQAAAYAASVVAADTAIGRLLSALEAAGLMEGAAIILTGDHGEALGETRASRSVCGHSGNPSFEPVLQVPLIVVPDSGDDATQPIRTDDVFRMIKRLAGLSTPERSDLGPGELLLEEVKFRTYRNGDWKSIWPRANPVPFERLPDGYFAHLTRPVLFNLADDPNETADLADHHPAILASHKKRIDELTEQFAAPPVSSVALSPLDRQRLQQLGYLRE